MTLVPADQRKGFDIYWDRSADKLTHKNPVEFVILGVAKH